MKKKALLVITDGIGYDKDTRWNAFAHAKKPTYDWLFENIPYSFLCTFGTEIGLPQGQMGNSEVGHMCIGAGRVLYQDLVKISMSLENGTLSQNPTLLEFINNKEVLHVCGLISDGGVHSHIEHLIGLAKILESRGKKVRLHAITDGRDVSPQSAKTYIKQILESNLTISTISGRFYAMDRDNRWERVQKAYESIAHGANPQENPLEYIDSQYAQGIFDEFIVPVSFDYHGIGESEGFIFTNFRSDRAREIVKALGIKDFSEFARAKYGKEIIPEILCMCEYDVSLPFAILFPKENVSNILPQILSEAGLKQAHIAETEKYAHVTFFFNGGREEPFENEYRVLIPSPKVATYDLQPEMSAKEVCEATMKAMKEEYDFAVVNFANGDMVGHTGDFNAAIKAVEAVDSELGRLIECARENHYSVIITSDHGNCEKMRDESGNILTNHTAGYVWCFVIDESVKNVRNGALDNLAPSILKLLGMQAPKEMSQPLF